MKDLKSKLKLYAVTDSSWLNGRRLRDAVEEAIIGGATMIQLREKELNDSDFIKLGLEIKEVCRKYNIPFIINDNVKVFKAVDADGIHVGQSDMRADLVREIIGEDKILGVSAETVEEAIIAEKMGADYLGVGTIFNTSTKLDAITVSKEELAHISYAVNIPVVAIGGITNDNIMELKNTLIKGVSVVSAIFAKKDIKNASKALLDNVNKYRFNPSDFDSFIIDYDGTLLNSLDMWDDVCSRFLKSKGKNIIGDVDKETKCMTNDEAALYIRDKYFSGIDVSKLLDMLNVFIKNEYTNIVVSDGAKAFLKEMKKGHKLYLYTATSSILVNDSLKKNGIYDIFDGIYTSTNFNVSKVDGVGYKKLINDLGLNPLKTIILEDAPHALKGAHDSGAIVCGVATKKNILKFKEINDYMDYYIDLGWWK